MSFNERQAVERDLKRRRQSYKGKIQGITTAKKTHLEVSTIDIVFTIDIVSTIYIVSTIDIDYKFHHTYSELYNYHAHGSNVLVMPNIQFCVPLRSSSVYLLDSVLCTS